MDEEVSTATSLTASSSSPLSSTSMDSKTETDALSNWFTPLFESPLANIRSCVHTEARILHSAS